MSLRFMPLVGWGALPPGWEYVDAAGVGVDSRGQVYVFNRGAHPVIVFDEQGRFLHCWGEGMFRRPHGITIAPDDTLFLTDDLGHTVRRFSTDGKLLSTLGTGEPSASGIQGNDYRTIRRGAPPFNQPTNVALNEQGEIFVSDGYGNARVHRFAPDGTLLRSWGEPGSGPGQFNLPHGIAIDKQGRVVVADRENNRLQFFTQEGEFLEQWQDVLRPMQVKVDPQGVLYVAEVGYRAGLYPWTDVPPGAPGARISVLDPHGKLIARFGDADRPCEPGNFFAPHDLCLDSHGSLYVAEVVYSAGGSRGLVPPTCHALQKLLRVG